MVQGTKGAKNTHGVLVGRAERKKIQCGKLKRLEQALEQGLEQVEKMLREGQQMQPERTKGSNRVVLDLRDLGRIRGIDKKCNGEGS